MTLDEARKIAAVAGTADGGCWDCVDRLVECLNETFPEFEWALARERMMGSLYQGRFIDDAEEDQILEDEKKRGVRGPHMHDALKVTVKAR